MLKAEKLFKINKALIPIVICALLIIPISANNFVTMLDHGLYYTSTTAEPNLINNTNGAGETISTITGLVPMWALDSYELGKTYTFTFRCSLDKDIQLSTKSAINTSHSKLTGVTKTAKLDKAYKSAEYNTETRELTFTVKLNTDITDLGGYPIYIYYYQLISTSVSNITTNGWSTSVETDPGGSEYIQDLINEVAQIRQNDENYYSSALETLDSIKTGIDQMPGEISTVLEQHDQQNKHEASTEGNDNINQATSALTNALPIASISDAITPLITACSYNGITSVWSFPALKIPAINGLFGEMQLSEQQNFDLCAYADQYIPDELLSIIRAVMTILLIVWAIREVMNLLSHLLGGGDG